MGEAGEVGAAAAAGAARTAGLPPAARARVAALAVEAFGQLSVDETPPALRALQRFTPSRRARLAAPAVVAGVETDETFRQRIAARVRLAHPHLAEVIDQGVTSAALDPVDTAAAAYLLRPPGWEGYVEAALADHVRAQRSEHQSELEATVAGLRASLAASAAAAADVSMTLRADLDAARAEAERLARELRAARSEVGAAQRAVAAAIEQRNEAVGRAEQAESDRARALTEADARVAGAEAVVEAGRRALRESRSLDETRARLLLDTIVEAAAGLRRELALPPVETRPADFVDAVRAQEPSPGDVGRRGRDLDDPHLLDQLLALPQAHLVVDGYNVTKTGFGDLPLETQRRRLLAGLGAVAARTGAEITCCFDGTALDTRVVASSPRGVRVLFSSPGETADELIRRLVRAEPEGRPLVVISSDREVASGVRRAGARALPATALLRRLGRV